MRFDETNWSKVSDLQVIRTESGNTFYTALFTPLEPCPWAWDPPTRSQLAFVWKGEIRPVSELSVVELDDGTEASKNFWHDFYSLV